MSKLSEALKSIIPFAPTIATALGGPAAGLAVEAIGHIFGIEKPTVDNVTEAIAKGQLSGDQIVQIKAAELAFQTKLKELGIREEELAYADTASARQREIAVKDKTPTLLAVLITFGFFGVLFYLLINGKPAGWGGEALLVMLGALGTAWANVVAYYFGSSAGSAAKNAAMERLASK